MWVSDLEISASACRVGSCPCTRLWGLTFLRRCSKTNEQVQEEFRVLPRRDPCCSTRPVLCLCFVCPCPPPPHACSYSHTACAGSNCLPCRPTLAARLFHRLDVCPGPLHGQVHPKMGQGYVTTQEGVWWRWKCVCMSGDGGLAMVPGP